MSSTTNKIPDNVIEQCRASIVDVVERYLPDLQKAGVEYEACCPFHDERSPSFKVNPAKQFFYCFGCGASGSAIDFVMNIEHVNFPEAVKRISGHAPATVEIKRTAPEKPVSQWKPITPIPADMKVPPRREFNKLIDGVWTALKPSKRWTYKDAAGQLLGYVYRFEKPGGGKETIPQTWCVDTTTGEASWQWVAFDKPRPLYGLDKLAAYPSAQVMLVEGEKACDAGQKLAVDAGVAMSSLVVISWPGGGKAIPHVDWSPLHGRKVGLWPDADDKNYPERHAKAGQKVPFLDQPGTAAMLAIFDEIQAHCPPIKFIVPPAGVADGWDVADEFPEGVTFLGHAKSAAIPAAEVRDRFAELSPEPEPEPEPAPPTDEAPPPDEAPYQEQSPAEIEVTLPQLDDERDYLAKNAHFTVLGYDGGDHYIFSHAKMQIMRVTKGDFGSEIGMIEMAAPDFWEMHFPTKGGFDRKQAAAWFFGVSHSRDIYDPSKIRGRGAWVDNKRSVFHHGDRLTVDGVDVNISKIASAYVYPRARAMPPLSDTPLTDEEGAHLLDVAKMARWTMPASAALLVGFVILAGICGALKWRPHLWLTGAAGSGKSTMLTDFLGALLNGVALFGNGNSTEAGLRQTLKADALPVILDEMEANNEGERRRIENILSMIRQSSSETQAKTFKGTTFGQAMNFHVRSMFCLASINTTLDKKADIDRLTKLSLMQPAAGGADQWEQLKEALHVINMDGQYPQRIMARAVNMLPTILHNINVFTKVAAKEFGSQRDGDQFGTLMAGAWSMISSVPVTDTQALLTIRKFDWKEHTEDHTQDDAMRALETLLSHKVRMNGSIGELSVYELIRETSKLHRLGVVDDLAADAALRRHGIRVLTEEGSVLFGITCTPLIEMVKHSAFATDLRGQLMRVPGAVRREKPWSFNGAKSRVVDIPLNKILDAPSHDDLPL